MEESRNRTLGFNLAGGLRIPLAPGIGRRPELKFWRIRGGPSQGLAGDNLVQAMFGVYFRD